MTGLAPTTSTAWKLEAPHPKFHLSGPEFAFRYPRLLLLSEGLRTTPHIASYDDMI